jgi:ERCC4-related helicase
LTYTYSYDDSINLHVEGRITPADAKRQRGTASVILQRLEVRPGIILADEVGMGKTFVALAVAASVALRDRRRLPVVVMVPPSLKDKWPKDFQLFRERCIVSESARKYLNYAVADNAIEFLKKLDDAAYDRVSIIFLTHGAMNPYRKLQDKYVKLAILQRATYRRRGAKHLRKALCRRLGALLRMKNLTYRNGDVWEVLLESPPGKWLEILKKHDMGPADDDDPVPAAVMKAMDAMDFGDLYNTLNYTLPRRESANIEQRLIDARKAINDKIVELWDHCLRSLDIRLPLLILDEAHHLKNPKTQFASLFQTQAAADDAKELAKGPLAEVFERMLFLTATPFQLGHYELCSVLERFSGISWRKPRCPDMGKAAFLKDLKTIQQKLDAAQESTLRLDHAWGKLNSHDLTIDGKEYESVDQWWRDLEQGKEPTPIAQNILERFHTAKKKMNDAEHHLMPYLVRHSREKTIQFEEKEMFRRLKFAGRTILDDQETDEVTGLDVQGDALLPFLLAARVTSLKPEARPVFAEGLASSYEAFLHTRRRNLEKNQGAQGHGTPTDIDDDPVETSEADQVTRWYLDRLYKSITSKVVQESKEMHPKVSATIQRALALWKKGEKVLVFCHYLRTGEILRDRIKAALKREMLEVAYRKLRCSKADAESALENLGRRFESMDSPVRRGTDLATERMLINFPALNEHSESLKKIVRRYLRTPSFLIRFFPIEQRRIKEDDVLEAMLRKDASGMSFDQLLNDFFHFLVGHCGRDERFRYISALEDIQPGQMVRLANGNTKHDTRQRLMLAFNTPFYPEILVASMIMAEGVDLHLNCRHIIHHDLCWNPSTLEQRTGRIDRIGAKVERCGQPIKIYLPFVAMTQDEKMYRVVMDRERWFGVVMGEKYKVDAKTTEKLAERIPFPEKAAKTLSFDFSVA